MALHRTLRALSPRARQRPPGGRRFRRCTNAILAYPATPASSKRVLDGALGTHARTRRAPRGGRAPLRPRKPISPVAHHPRPGQAGRVGEDRSLYWGRTRFDFPCTPAKTTSTFAGVVPLFLPLCQVLTTSRNESPAL